MFVAKKLKDESVCEYLLYMWQMEDILRAYQCDIDLLVEGYLSHFNLHEEEMRMEIQWYQYLADMMRDEGTQVAGHLQMNQGTLILLNDLHQALLEDPQETEYNAAYYKALPYIVELRAKSGKQLSELETSLNAMYGVMLLRLQKKEVSKETQTAVDAISHMLALLSKEWKEERNR